MWIARDEDGSLWLYNEKPTKGKHVWLSSLDIDTQHRLNERLFPKVQWSDQEPRELILKSTKKNKHGKDK